MNVFQKYTHQENSKPVNGLVHGGWDTGDVAAEDAPGLIRIAGTREAQVAEELRILVSYCRDDWVELECTEPIVILMGMRTGCDLEMFVKVWFSPAWKDLRMIFRDGEQPFYSEGDTKDTFFCQLQLKPLHTPSLIKCGSFSSWGMEHLSHREAKRVSGPRGKNEL